MIKIWYIKPKNKQTNVYTVYDIIEFLPFLPYDQYTVAKEDVGQYIV